MLNIHLNKWPCVPCEEVILFLRFCIWSLNLPVDLQIDLFLPTGQQDVYDKTGNNNTLEVSANPTLASLR